MANRDSSENAANVKGSIELWRNPWFAVLLHVFWLPTAAVLVIGTWNVRGMTVWSLTSLTYAAVLALRGWTPWRMPVWELYASRIRKSPPSPAQVAVLDFLKRPTIRMRSGALAGASALTPWLLAGIARLCHISPIGYLTRSGLPLFMWFIAGFVDAIRGGVLAMRYMAGEVIRNWSSLTRETLA
jgi:hypothetical protein